MHSNMSTVKPMYRPFAHPLKLNSSPLSLDQYKSTKAVILITAGGRVMSAVGERPREETWMTCQELHSTRGFCGRVESMYFETRCWIPSDLAEQRQHRFCNDFASRRARRVCLLVKEIGLDVFRINRCRGTSNTATLKTNTP